MKLDENTVALIIGASRGFGYATAVALANKGAHIIAMARTVGGLEELADDVESSGGSITLVPLDILDHEGIKRMCISIFERWGKLDLLIHCAAHAAPLSPVPHISEKDFELSWNVNVQGTRRIITCCEPLLKNGTAVFLDDRHENEKFFSAYACSKSAARALILAWQQETKKLQTNVELFEPNPMSTAIRARFFPGENTKNLESPTHEAARLLNLINTL